MREDYCVVSSAIDTFDPPRACITFPLILFVLPKSIALFLLFFFGLNPATVRRLGAATSDSLMVPAWTERQRPTLEVCLIRCSAGCPVSIRNAFVGSRSLFPTSSLERPLHRAPLWYSGIPKSFVHRKNVRIIFLRITVSYL